jgi:hypothetical protein
MIENKEEIKMRHLGRKNPNSNLLITEMTKEDFVKLPEWSLYPFGLSIEGMKESQIESQIKLIKPGKEKIWWRSWIEFNMTSYWVIEYAYLCPQTSKIEVQRRAVEFVK